MIVFKTQKKKDTIPRILGGLTIPSGVAIIFLFVISLPAIFLPVFRPIKIAIAGVILLAAYGIASFIDVSNKGFSNISKRIFSKKITAVKIKSLKPFKLPDDTEG
jgi:hypothetical protein